MNEADSPEQKTAAKPKDNFINNWINHLRISTKLTLVNVAILGFILFVTNIMTTAGTYFTVYHQASVEMDYSIERSVAAIAAANPVEMPQNPPPLPDYYNRSRHIKKRHGSSHHSSALDKRRKSEEKVQEAAAIPRSKRPRFIHALALNGAIIPGVILRVVNDDGELVFDGSPHYPSLDEVRGSIVGERPFWLTVEHEMAAIDNLYLFYNMKKIRWDGEEYELHFLRTITAERHFLSALGRVIITACLLGIAIAIMAGIFVSKKTLRPISTITQTAKEIEVSDLSRRIPTTEVRDELSELIDTFNHMLDRLQAGFEHERRFVSDASHELRTPITVIRGYVDMLLRWGKNDPETLAESLSAISTETENMQHLVENLLFLARADLKRQTINLKRVALAELIGEVATKAQLVAAEKGDHVVTLEANDAADVIADEFMLKEILRTFLDNALKYTPAGGHIAIASRRDGNRVKITVKDDGIGIAESDQAKVFDRFFRVDKARTKDGGTKASGIGLGLAIARQIADIHQTSIELDSKLGEGTEIGFSLPCE